MVRILSILLIVLLNGCTDNTPSKGFLKLHIDEPVWKESIEMYSEDSLLRSLEAIKSFHIQNATGIRLQNPASMEDLKRAESYFKCELPEELNLIWGWHNGESTDGFIWYHEFLSIDESIKQHKSLVELDYLDWQANWIPIFEFQEEWYGVPCKKEDIKASPVVFYFIESGTVVAYVNITKYMELMARSIDSGVVGWKDGWWDADSKGIAGIYQEIKAGPGFPYYAGD